MNKLKIIFIIYLLLASFSALAEEDVYYCNLTEAKYISSTENKNEKLDHAFFLKVNEYTKEMEFSENFVSLEFNDAELFDQIFRESPFFIAPFKIQELADDALFELKSKLTSEPDSDNDLLFLQIEWEMENSIFAQHPLMKSMTLHLQKPRGILGISINYAEYFIILFANCTGFKN